MQLKKLVFPQPEGPTSPMMEPPAIFSDTASRTTLE